MLVPSILFEKGSAVRGNVTPSLRVAHPEAARSSSKNLLKSPIMTAYQNQLHPLPPRAIQGPPFRLAASYDRSVFAGGPGGEIRGIDPCSGEILYSMSYTSLRWCSFWLAAGGEALLVEEEEGSLVRVALRSCSPTKRERLIH
jgi:hypothetical protein